MRGDFCFIKIQHFLPSRNLQALLRNAIFTKPLTARGVQFYGEEEMKMQSCPEVDGVAYMPGVYKRLMVRMSERTDELANVRA